MSAHDTSAQDQVALKRALAVSPTWTGLARAGDALATDRTLLHAGPPITDRGAMARPILNSAALASVYEGWCDTPDDGERMILGGEIGLSPAQDHAVVVPLAGIVSQSMVLQRVVDAADADRVAWSPFNGGMGPAMRLGLRDVAVIERWRWLNGSFAEALEPALTDGIDLIEIARHSLSEGDDCHGRTPAATARLIEMLRPRLADSPGANDVLTFLSEAPGFFLNLWMAATKCILMAADGTEGSALVTALAGNGIESGLQIAGLQGRWFTAPATPPDGDIPAPYTAADRLGAIGDSAIVDAFGLGAMAMWFSPEQQKAMSGHAPADALQLPERLLLARHPGFGKLDLLVGQSVAKVSALGTAGLVSLGILDKAGEGGRIGGGIYQPPVELFRAASEALAAQ